VTHVVHFGVYCSCDEFVDAAVKAGHPVSRANCLPQVLQEAVNATSTKSLFQLAKGCLATLSHWLDRARVLSSSEKELYNSLREALGRSKKK